MKSSLESWMLFETQKHQFPHLMFIHPSNSIFVGSYDLNRSCILEQYNIVIRNIIHYLSQHLECQPTVFQERKINSCKCLDCQLTTISKVGTSYIISITSLTVGDTYVSYMYIRSPLSRWLNFKDLILTLSAIASVWCPADLSFNRKEY